MLNKDAVLDQIDTVLAEFDEASTHGADVDEFGIPMLDAAVRVRMQAAIQRLAPRSSTYAIEAKDARHDIGTPVHRTYAGILRAMRKDIEADWLVSVEGIVHAETFSDFLEMASGLLEKGYKDAAAVIAGSVLEGHLRSLASQTNLGVEKANGTPRKADTLNADLRKANVYNLLQQKQVTAWLGLRNDAAHGEYDEYDGKQVASLIVSVRDFLLKYPA